MQKPHRRNPSLLLCLPILGLALALPACADDATVAADFRKTVQPILSKYCYDCHADGAQKGGVSLDEFDSNGALTHSPELWWRVLKNTRAGLMPPPKKPQPTPADRAVLDKWIKYDAFGLDPKNPDPGRVTIRRLNRVEYRNTIRDLMGVEFKAEEEFPADDTGYGFDNIGDVLTISPLLLEKYMQAAEVIVRDAVPTVPTVMPERTIPGSEFRGPNGANGQKLSFYTAAKVANSFKVERAGEYRLVLDLTIAGSFEFDPGRCKVTFTVDGKPLLDREFDWEAGKKYSLPYDLKWAAGEHPITLSLEPLVPVEKKVNKVDLKINGVTLQGPTDPKYWNPTKNYARFFPRPVSPTSPGERRQYAAEILRTFATRAFRRPVDDRTVQKLTSLAESYYSRPGRRFEEGIGQAIVATLASPRFLFRTEQPLPGQPGARFPRIDEYSLASRLSYFLWSNAPDPELFQLAQRGELRKNLEAQVKRMLADARADQFVQNFTGQWLEARDVEGTSINPRSILRADGFPVKFDQKDPNKLNADFNEVRAAMRRETQMYFARIVREDRSLLDVIDSDYTFLNEKLAAHYGIPGVKGNDMRLVQLPKDSPRGGMLTQGTMLIVTSNPTRTSPVKRGVFILDNILGTPTPPPPPNIPPLESSGNQVKGHEPTVREIMEIHRAKPLCASCHARMDPLGLGLEQFNAMGMWREKERGVPVDPTGTLVSGESFKGIKELKTILKDKHRAEFYRCVTEKLLTYALGRGVEYYDTETVDQIVEALQKRDGHFGALLYGVIESAPFQRARPPQVEPATKPTVPSATRADASE